MSFDKFLKENENFYNKNLLSYKGRINRWNYFLNSILINLSCVFIITIPFAIILHIFNSKKRIFDITERENFSWIATFFLHILSGIAYYACNSYTNPNSSLYEQHDFFIVSFKLFTLAISLLSISAFIFVVIKIDLIPISVNSLQVS